MAEPETMNIKKQFMLSSLVIILLLTISLTAANIYNIQKTAQAHIDLLQEEILSSKREYIKDIVSLTIQEIEYERNRCLENEKPADPDTDEQVRSVPQCNETYIKEQMTNRIRATELKDNGYIWINEVRSMDGGDNYAVRLVHPNLPETEGMLLSTKTQDVKGNFPYLEELEGVKKSGDIFFEYWFKRMDSEEIQPKLTYAKLYKPYNWIIATGVYLEDIKQLVDLNKNESSALVKKSLGLSLLLAGLLSFVAWVLSSFFGNRINKTFHYYNQQIIAREEDLQKLNETLEAKVLSRTEDLDISERKYRAYIANAPEGIFVFDVEGRYIDVNESACLLTGYSRAAMLNKTILEMVPSGMQAKAQDDFEILKRESVLQTEYQLLKRDGTLIDVSLKAVQLPDHNLIAFCNDITEFKENEKNRLELENQLRQKYKMEAIGVMAEGMAHNFNNNLSIILGNIELSKMKVPEKLKIGNYLDNARIAVLRSRDLISQVMSYSRQEVQNKAPLQCYSVLNETLQLLRSIIPTTINLQHKISVESQDAIINADASRFQECLINLCNNAVQSMNEKGGITVSLQIETLGKHDIPAQYDAKPGCYAKLSVTDTGCGMSAENMEKIFDLFYTTKPVGEGTGVGLSTVMGIVKQHGGLIKVHSVLDEGTTFELYFPIMDNLEDVEEQDVSDARPKGTERILFVDDEEMLAELGSIMLAERGYLVTMMTDSQEASKLFAANADNFDLVITDQVMPGLTGTELIQELKTVRPDLPAIMCTGCSSMFDAEEAKSFGINAFLMKPLSMPELLQTIRRVLDGEK